MCVYEMLSGRVPFEKYDHDTIVENVARGKERPTIPQNTPPDLARLVQTCWNDSPARRPHFEVIVSTLEKIISGL
jgi:Protein tyrosine and serine/threonine kinase